MTLVSTSKQTFDSSTCSASSLQTWSQAGQRKLQPVWSRHLLPRMPASAVVVVEKCAAAATMAASKINFEID